MQKRMSVILILLTCLCLPTFTFAEIIVLKSGKTIEGKLIEKTDKYIKIDFQGVSLTYFFDEVQSVDGANINEAEKRNNIQPPISKENKDTISNDKIYTQESSDSAYQKGASYLKQNKLDEAIGEFSKVIEFNSRSDKAYYDRGRAYGAKGDLELALADYTQVININSPETIQSAYNNRGLIYEDKGDLGKALEDYTKGIEAMPNPMFSGFRYFKQVLHRNRAQVYLSRKEFDKALDDVRSIEKLGGSVDPGFIKKIKNHDSDVEAKVVLQGSSEKYPGSSSEVNLYNSRGYQSFEKGQYDLAIEDYNRALAVDSNVAIVYANRANAYAAKGRLNEAITDYNKALEINPRDEKVCHDLGLAYAAKRDHEKALYYFNKTLEINPQVENDGQFHNNRGVAYFFLKDYSKCWQDVNKAIELGYSVHPQFLRELKKTSGRDK